MRHWRTSRQWHWRCGVLKHTLRDKPPVAQASAVGILQRVVAGDVIVSSPLSVVSCQEEELIKFRPLQWLVVVVLGLLCAAAVPPLSPTTQPALGVRSSPGGD